MNEQLKQAIWESWEEDQKTNPNPVNPHAFEYGAKVALSTPSILRHADPEIMKQAGWVREDDIVKLIKLRISQLKLRESELLWNIHDMPFQSYITQERNRRELDKTMFTRHEMEILLSEYIQPPK